MTRQDIEEAIKRAKEHVEKREPLLFTVDVDTLIQVTEAFLKLEEWLTPKKVGTPVFYITPTNPIDATTILGKMRELLNPPAKTDLERIRAVFNRAYHDLKEFIDQLEKEKEKP